MVVHLSVILFTGGGVCLSACWERTPWEQTPSETRHPPPGTRHLPGADPWSRPPRSRHHLGADPHLDSYCCGRYASYWNTFLLGSVIFLSPSFPVLSLIAHAQNLILLIRRYNSLIIVLNSILHG